MYLITPSDNPRVDAYDKAANVDARAVSAQVFHDEGYRVAEAGDVFKMTVEEFDAASAAGQVVPAQIVPPPAPPAPPVDPVPDYPSPGIMLTPGIIPAEPEHAKDWDKVPA